MVIDKAQLRRRALRIMVRWTWKEILLPFLVVFAFALAVSMAATAWIEWGAWTVLAPTALVAVGWIGFIAWCNAEDKARGELLKEHWDRCTRKRRENEKS